MTEGLEIAILSVWMDPMRRSCKAIGELLSPSMNFAIQIPNLSISQVFMAQRLRYLQPLKVVHSFLVLSIRTGFLCCPLRVGIYILWAGGLCMEHLS